MNWTAAQQQAINESGRSIIVPAAAGSGKTAVLVERLLRLLSDTETPISADSILVSTFTRDAAAQMKRRLKRAMDKRISEYANQPEKEEMHLHLLHQQVKLENADIATIDSFCIKLLRENVELCGGITSGFRILEESEASGYRKTAMQETLEWWNREHPVDMEMLYDVLCDRQDDRLTDLIEKIEDYLTSVDYPEQWMDRAIAISCDTDKLLAWVRSSLRATLEEILPLVEFAREYAEEIFGSGTENKCTNIFEKDLELLHRHMAILESGNLSSLCKDETLIKNDGKLPWQTFSSPRKDFDKEARDTLRNFRDGYKTKCEKYANFCVELVELEEDIRVGKMVIPALLALTRDYLQRVLALKVQHDALEFGDTLQIALGLLGEIREDGRIYRSQLCREYSEKISLIMVDEYQDVNNKQDTLFKLLSRGGEEGKLTYGTNVFLVGDIKQAIYRFRKANPGNFQGALAASTLLAEATPEDHIVRIPMSKNFRSSEAVIDFVNDLCQMMMSLECGDVCYDNPEERLFQGAVHYQGTELDCKTQLLYATKETEEKRKDCDVEDSEEPMEGAKNEDPQIRVVADKIAHMLHNCECYPVIESDGSTRPCRPDDFCVIARKNKYGVLLKQALARRGILASVGKNETEFLIYPEIQLALAFLRILQNPLCDLDLTVVLTSPVFCFTMDDIAEVKLSGGGEQLYPKIVDYVHNNRNTVASKCMAFLRIYERLRRRVDGCSIDRLLQALYQDTDLVSLQELYKDSELRRARLLLLVEYAKGFHARSDIAELGSLSSWLRELDALQKQKKKKDLAGLPLSVTARNAVAFKSIHGSKGLEYSFVFLIKLDDSLTGGSSRDDSVELICNEEGLLGFSRLHRESFTKGKTLIYDILKKQDNSANVSEELRLLYVAMTRAKQQLFMVIDHEKICSVLAKNEKGLAKPKFPMDSMPTLAPLLARHAKSMLDWIGWYIAAKGCYEQLSRCANIELPSCRLCTVDPYCGGEEIISQRIALTAQIDKNAYEEMLRNIEGNYQSRLQNLPAKFSVTSIAHPNQTMQSQVMRSPEFLAEEKTTLKGASRGHAVHKCMQYLDFALARENLTLALDELCYQQQILTKTERDAIPIWGLQRFLASELATKLLHSPNVYREKKFYVKIGELAIPETSPLMRDYRGTDGILNGTMDLLYQDQDEWILVDYKTDSGKDPEELVQRYALQIGLYQKAAERIVGSKVKGSYLYSFALGRFIKINTEELEFTYRGEIIHAESDERISEYDD